ncbi:LysR family transcriptional regulator [Alteromonas ponticola]|uniref:LysR family transcriptional regulator n=1 Tax=Alteromonas aquimaris TaxID=2998417 RepID=A0ABT3P4Z3_9ALTE|nr:LysR family transcriptional regulator [Alteromonas aquimaris]MCW8107834.1 LysR family transcriptional regulator [Alteromonas aquimaris]
MINTVWLKTFCTLVETKHFTLTADKLFMTQSGVSQHIKKLEKQIGAPLVAREDKQFSLTEAGKKLYLEGKEIVELLSTVQQRVTADPAFEGTVRIMSPGSVGLKLYPHLLAFQRRHPKLNIDYRFAPNEDTVEALTESNADIGLVTTEPANNLLVSEAIGEEALVVITPEKTMNVDWEILSRLGFINHPDGEYHAKLLLSANFPEYAENPQLRHAGFCNQIALIPEPVSLGLGFTVLPQYAVESFAKPQLIRVHRLPVPVSETLYLCSRRQRFVPHRVKVMMDEIKRKLA